MRPTSWAVTGDAGKVIWIQGGMMRNVKKQKQTETGVNTCGQVDDSGNTDTY